MRTERIDVMNIVTAGGDIVKVDIVKGDDSMISIELGDQVMDLVSGLSGVATARVTYLNGCVQYCVQPVVDKDGKKVDAHYIDVSQLQVISAGFFAQRARDARRDSGGGAMSNTPPTEYHG